LIHGFFESIFGQLRLIGALLFFILFMEEAVKILCVCVWRGGAAHGLEGNNIF
jgi:hypothetical protein